jgi:T5SS/PEP-CTERM-associated repeat protein
MAMDQWTGNAGTGAFATAGNWQTAPGTAATEPPGPSDTAIIVDAAMPITGTGTAKILNFGGTDKVAGHLVATYGCPVNANLVLLPGATLTTPMLHIVVDFGPNPPTTGTATVTVGERSHVVISGCNPPDTYAIQIANMVDSDGTLVVQGAHAVVNGGNLPMSVGQEATGVLTIRHGAEVSVGNGDPLIYPWALVIGNHPGSSGMVEVSHASLLAHGQVIVGRKSAGTLDVNEGGLVVAEDMAIGWAPNGGHGSVTVKGNEARLIVDNLLEVQHMGVGSLTIAEHGFVSAGIAITVNGALSLADGQIETTALGVNPGATLTGHGTVIAASGFNNNGGAITADQQLNLIGDIDNAGTITVAAGGELRCFGTLDDTGSIDLQTNSVASLEAVASGQTITFAGNNAKLVLRSPGAFSGTIQGFALTHSIELEAEATGRNFANPVLTLTGPAGNVVARLQMQGAYTTNNFNVAPGLPSVITFV